MGRDNHSCRKPMQFLPRKNLGVRKFQCPKGAGDYAWQPLDVAKPLTGEVRPLTWGRLSWLSSFDVQRRPGRITGSRNDHRLPSKSRGGLQVKRREPQIVSQAFRGRQEGS